MEGFLRILRVLMVRKLGDRAVALVRESESVRNHPMILYRLSKELLMLGPELAPMLLRELVMGSARHAPGFPEYVRHLGDVRTLATHTGNDFMSEVLRRSRRSQMDEVVELLTDVPPVRRIYHTEEIENRNPAQDYVPLGVRKSLARRPHPATLESLLQEQDPSVVRNLLGNPRTVEEMVVKMASLRPTSSAVLEEISIHPKWSTIYRVGKALAFNPYSPPRVVHAVLPTLLLKDLIDVSISTTLHPNVRAAAKRFIIHRISAMNATEREQFSERFGEMLKRIFLQTG
jgi:hypothetical protein